MTSPGRSGIRGLPAYVVLDTSASMKPHEELLNGTLAEIYDTLISSPQVMEFVHLSIITFNTEPHVVIGMTELDTLRKLPRVHCGGSTNYAPMFNLIRDRIDIDAPALSAAGVNVLRPVVFLLTDGAPTDIISVWTEALSTLKDPAWRRHPHIITYGFGNSSETVLRQVSTLAAYLAEEPGDNRTALASALSSLLSSLVTSAQSRQLQVPEEVEGYRSLPIDYIEC